MMNNSAHPGVILLEDYLKPLAISVDKAAMIINVSREHLLDITSGYSPVTPDMAVRFGVLTNTSAKMWLGIQNNHDLSQLDMAEYERIKNFLK